MSKDYCPILAVILAVAHGYLIGENGAVFISNAQEKAETVLDRIKV